MNRNFISILQILFSLALVFLVMIQAKGGGLGSTFGGAGGFYRSKRGLEKIVYYLTIFIAVSFFILSTVNFIFFS